MNNQNSIMLIIDEAGFGTKPLRKYAYSHIGVPAVLETKSISHNLTCTATISAKGIELLKFFSQGGTHNETFQEYFDELLNQMKIKYPDKKLVFILDNLAAHKSSLIMRIMQDDKAKMLLTPSNSPQFSPIENMFGLLKQKLMDLEITSKEQLTKTIIETMLGFKKTNFEGFFKKTLSNMQSFWFKLNRVELLNKIQELENN